MLTRLGRIIEKKPWFVIIIIILITIGFSTFLPQLEFKTDFSDFYPDDEIVVANTRIIENFGTTQSPIFLLVEKQRAENMLTPQAIREISFIQNELEKLPEVNGTIAFTTFLNTVCLVEFGKTIENCTDEQLETAVQDMLLEQQTGELQLFSRDDPNEPIDYNRYPRMSQGESIDSADIKNCYLAKDNDTITFSFEVYDLSTVGATLRPSLTKVNVMEWYLDFNNLIRPDEDLDIAYRIAAHIEPTYPLWELGKGVVDNLRELLHHMRNRDRLNSYTPEAYLWIKPPQQTMYFPLPLTTGDITFDTSSNRINIVVSREELGQYGIATRIGTFELPAKLSDFTAGVRYYQTPLLKRPGGRVTVNTSFLFERLEKIRTRPILGSIATQLLQKYGDLTWEEFDQLFELMGQVEYLPDTIALQDIDSAWIPTDSVPDMGVADTVFYIYPYLFDELQVNALAFLSEDYEQLQGPTASLIIVPIDWMTWDYDKVLRINEKILTTAADLDSEYTEVSIEATGETVVQSQINELTSEANQILGPAIFIIIVIILFVNFRKTSYVFLPMVALLVSTIWLFGTMALLGITFNVIAVALVPLILGLGVDYSVHLFHNYQTELEKGRTPADAIKRSVKDIGTAMFLAWLTTVIAFMSFLSASIPPMRTFGVLLAAGVTYTFITAITLLASARYLLDRRKKPTMKRKPRPLSVRTIMGKTASTVLCHQKKLLVIMIFISIVFATGALQLETGFDMDQFLPENNPAMNVFDKIAEKFPYASQDQEYILIEGNVATVETLWGIAQTHENIEDDTYVSRKPDGSVKITSIYSVIQDAVKNNNSLVEAFNLDEKTGIPTTDQNVRALFDYLYENAAFDIDFEMDTAQMGEFDLDMFAGGETQMVLFKNNTRYEATLIRVNIDPTFQLSGGNLFDDLGIIKNELNDDMVSYGDTTNIATGLFIIQLTITKSLTESQILSTGISLLLAALVLILVYRKPTLGLITMIPVGMTIVWILGTMYYFGYMLDVMTVTVTSITIGIGIDYAIHVTERFRLVADKTGDVAKAACEAISHTGGALLIAALTTTLGFGILVLAPIPPQQRFGIILAITIAYSFLISVLLLPLFLAHWAKWRKKHKGFIISPRPPEEDAKSDEYCDHECKQ